MFGARTGNPWEFVALALYLGLCVAGGWSLVRSGFEGSPGDRPLVGGALGLVLATWGANLLGRWIDPAYAFWISALTLAAAGGLAWRASRNAARGRIDPRSFALLAAVLALAILFYAMARGVAIFDDRKNLSLISLMAAGGTPPRFYMNPDFPFAYHYAFQLFGAILMRIGGMLPWTAFDLAKGIAAALAIGLGVVWARRATGRWLAGLWVGVVLLLGAGSRWLLLFLPSAWVASAGRDLAFWGTTAQMRSGLTELLGSAWLIDGGPPVPLPFAFVNGILQPLILHLQTGPASMGLIALLLLLILYPSRARRWTWFIFVALLAFWALAAEAGFVLFGLGAVGAFVVVLLRRGPLSRRRAAGALLGAVVAAALLGSVQGGTITEAMRGLISPVGTAAETPGIAGFTLRPSPAIVSSHFGELRLTRPGELLIGIVEVGPALLFAPLAVWVMLRSARRHRILILALSISTFLGFLVPVVLRYEVDRDITRMTYYALLGWILLAVVPLSLAWFRGTTLLRAAIVVVTASLVVSGVALTGPMVSATSRAVLPEGFRAADTSMARLVWDRLEPGSLVVDSSAWRAVAVTGRLTRSAQDSATGLESWEQLVEDGRVGPLVAAGFDYAYVDRTWWDDMSPAARLSFEDGCVREIAAVHDDGANGDRWLYDLRACSPE